MRRLKTVISVTGILLLILSAASIYVALQSLSELRPAEDYEDRGVLTFKPYQASDPVPMTMIGRYQLMCGVPADEWAVHVTVRDVETDEVLFERNYSAEDE